MDEMNKLREKMKDPEQSKSAGEKMNVLMQKLRGKDYEKLVMNEVEVKPDEEITVNFVIK